MSQRLMIVTGKGGVGRSAVTAALALQAAHRGQRVLTISMTDQAGLAAHLGVKALRYKPSEIRPGLFAAAINRPDALDEYLRLQLGVPRITRMGPIARAFDALASAAPGIRETVTIGKVLYEAKAGDWDLVVADAPPTGQIGSHLRAPRTISELVGTGRVRQQIQWMRDFMADPDTTSLVLVSLAEELPAIEASETLAWLSHERLISLSDVMVNRMLEPLGAALPAATGTPVADAAHLHAGIYAEQQRWLELIDPTVHLPYLFGVTGPVEVAERLADRLDER